MRPKIDPIGPKKLPGGPQRRAKSEFQPRYKYQLAPGSNGLPTSQTIIHPMH